MALGSEGFFSPEGLQGGESRGGGRGEWPVREVREQGPHLPSLQGVPKESVEPLRKCVSAAPTRLAALSVVPALSCRYCFPRRSAIPAAVK